MDEKLGLFQGEDRPDVHSAWAAFSRGMDFNNQINLEETVKVNRNFFIGKQWEGVQANGLPTPVFNVLKRVTGFLVASGTTENLKVNASTVANTPNANAMSEVVRVVNAECDALMERNKIPALARDMYRDAAVAGDGCLYTYWDPDVDCGEGVMGAVKTEVVDNTRVMFGNPNSQDVQSQPYIIISSRESVLSAKKRARRHKSPDWKRIQPVVGEDQAIDTSRWTDDKTTVLMTLWRDEDTGEIWAYESTRTAQIREPWSLGIRLYPVCWLCWDKIQDCYHGQAMITGLIPNQIFINKCWAMSMLSIPHIIHNDGSTEDSSSLSDL